jgi:hypothetical protein
LAERQKTAMGYLLVFATVVASLFIVDYLAWERGLNRHRWRVTAASIGPLAIPLVYVMDGFRAVRKMISAPKP